jgi:hypothetical protein
MTNSKWFSNADPDVIGDLLRRISAVETYANDLERRFANLDSPYPIARVDPVSYLNPYEGQRAIDPTDEQHMWYSNGEWRKAAGFGIYEIKVFEDINPVVVGDDKFIWEIPEDLDEAEVIKVEGFVSTVGSGSTQVAIRLASPPGSVPADILSAKIIIDAGEHNSKDAGAQPVINTNTIVAWGDHLHIDVDAAGSGAKGLGIIVVCNPSPAGSGTFQGEQGPPGGVIGWMGQFPGGSAAATTPGGAGSAWVTATGYTTGNVVVNGGTYYVATANHTSGALTEPGVGANWQTVWQVLTYTTGQAVTSGGTTYVTIVDHTSTTTNAPGTGANWEDFWMVLVEGHEPFGGCQVVINGNGYALDTGIKAHLPIPFDCEIIEATLLADITGSCVVDLWTDTYGSYPPTNADSITGSTPLTLTAANKTTDVALTGWTTTLTAGDTLAVVIESVSTITLLTVGLRLQRP